MTTQTPSDFARRVAAAARAAWWTLPVGAIIVTALFFAFNVVIMHVECLRHELACLGATEADMFFVRWLVLVWLLICIFLSLWARVLRRAGAA